MLPNKNNQTLLPSAESFRNFGRVSAASKRILSSRMARLRKVTDLTAPAAGIIYRARELMAADPDFGSSELHYRLLNAANAAGNKTYAHKNLDSISRLLFKNGLVLDIKPNESVATVVAEMLRPSAITGLKMGFSDGTNSNIEPSMFGLRMAAILLGINIFVFPTRGRVFICKHGGPSSTKSIGVAPILEANRHCSEVHIVVATMDESKRPAPQVDVAALDHQAGSRGNNSSIVQYNNHKKTGDINGKDKRYDGYETTKERLNPLNEFEKMLNYHSRTLYDVPGDGNCFFRACMDQLEGSQIGHLQLRIDVANHMWENKTDFMHLDFDGLPFDAYLAKLKLPAQIWGGDMEALAVAQLKGVYLEIWVLNHPYPQLFPGPKDVDDGKPTIRILYHQNHYYSIRDIPFSPVTGPLPIAARAHVSATSSLTQVSTTDANVNTVSALPCSQASGAMTTINLEPALPYQVDSDLAPSLQENIAVIELDEASSLPREIFRPSSSIFDVPRGAIVYDATDPILCFELPGAPNWDTASTVEDLISGLSQDESRTPVSSYGTTPPWPSGLKKASSHSGSVRIESEVEDGLDDLDFSDIEELDLDMTDDDNPSGAPRCTDHYCHPSTPMDMDPEQAVFHLPSPPPPEVYYARFRFGPRQRQERTKKSHLDGLKPSVCKTVITDVLLEYFQHVFSESWKKALAKSTLTPNTTEWNKHIHQMKEKIWGDTTASFPKKSPRKVGSVAVPRLKSMYPGSDMARLLEAADIDVVLKKLNPPTSYKEIYYTLKATKSRETFDEIVENIIKNGKPKPPERKPSKAGKVKPSLEPQQKKAKVESLVQEDRGDDNDDDGGSDHGSADDEQGDDKAELRTFHLNFKQILRPDMAPWSEVIIHLITQAQQRMAACNRHLQECIRLVLVGMARGEVLLGPAVNVDLRQFLPDSFVIRDHYLRENPVLPVAPLSDEVYDVVAGVTQDQRLMEVGTQNFISHLRTRLHGSNQKQPKVDDKWDDCFRFIQDQKDLLVTPPGCSQVVTGFDRTMGAACQRIYNTDIHTQTLKRVIHVLFKTYEEKEKDPKRTWKKADLLKKKKLTKKRRRNLCFRNHRRRQRSWRHHHIRHFNKLNRIFDRFSDGIVGVQAVSRMLSVIQRHQENQGYPLLDRTNHKCQIDAIEDEGSLKHASFTVVSMPGNASVVTCQGMNQDRLDPQRQIPDPASGETEDLSSGIYSMTTPDRETSDEETVKETAAKRRQRLETATVQLCLDRAIVGDVTEDDVRRQLVSHGNVSIEEIDRVRVLANLLRPYTAKKGTTGLVPRHILTTLSLLFLTNALLMAAGEKRYTRKLSPISSCGKTYPVPLNAAGIYAILCARDPGHFDVKGPNGEDITSELEARKTENQSSVFSAFFNMPKIHDACSKHNVIFDNRMDYINEKKVTITGKAIPEGSPLKPRRNPPKSLFKKSKIRQQQLRPKRSYWQDQVVLRDVSAANAERYSAEYHKIADELSDDIKAWKKDLAGISGKRREIDVSLRSLAKRARGLPGPKSSHRTDQERSLYTELQKYRKDYNALNDSCLLNGRDLDLVNAAKWYWNNVAVEARSMERSEMTEGAAAASTAGPTSSRDSATTLVPDQTSLRNQVSEKRSASREGIVNVDSGQGTSTDPGQGEGPAPRKRKLSPAPIEATRSAAESTAETIESNKGIWSGPSLKTLGCQVAVDKVSIQGLLRELGESPVERPVFILQEDRGMKKMSQGIPTSQARIEREIQRYQDLVKDSDLETDSRDELFISNRNSFNNTNKGSPVNLNELKYWKAFTYSASTIQQLSGHKKHARLTQQLLRRNSVVKAALQDLASLPIDQALTVDRIRDSMAVRHHHAPIINGFYKSARLQQSSRNVEIQRRKTMDMVCSDARNHTRWQGEGMPTNH
ncbi:hypothetical protein BGZ83_004656 [Gryganskiella cystojenkinii]|nr:hypothetical protein BGZ83_004656 [Gryganskiella cystojenkinii]